MAVFRLPPVAQFQQPRVYPDTRSIDAPNPQPPDGLPEYYWVRRRHCYEAEQQPRRLLDISITQSVDAPIPNAVPIKLPARSRWPYPSARGLPVDVLAPAVVADSPTGAPSTQWVSRPQTWEQWLQAERLPVDYMASVDSPPGFLVQRPPVRSTSLAQWHQATPGLISGPDNPPPPVQQVAAYMRTAAAVQAYRKAPSVLFLVTVETPPLAGPFQQAPYRRPVPPTPRRVPSTAVLVIEPPPPDPTLVPPLSTSFATDGSRLTSAIDAGIRVTVSTVDGRYVTHFVSDGVTFTENNS